MVSAVAHNIYSKYSDEPRRSGHLIRLAAPYRRRHKPCCAVVFFSDRFPLASYNIFPCCGRLLCCIYSKPHRPAVATLLAHWRHGVQLVLERSPGSCEPPLSASPRHLVLRPGRAVFDCCRGATRNRRRLSLRVLVCWSSRDARKETPGPPMVFEPWYGRPKHDHRSVVSRQCHPGGSGTQTIVGYCSSSQVGGAFFLSRTQLVVGSRDL